MRRSLLILLLAFTAVSGIAEAGPPYASDDPEPTDFKHFEIYLFANGTNTRDGSGGAYGIDFNYGATPNLQLTAVFPVEYDNPRGASSLTGLGNIELAAKYRFRHETDDGWDVAVFPRVFLPSASAQVGERHFSLLVPLWLGKDWGRWSTFGGGGCVFGRGGESQDYCLAGWALTRAVARNLSWARKSSIKHRTRAGATPRQASAPDCSTTLTKTITCWLMPARACKTPRRRAGIRGTHRFSGRFEKPKSPGSGTNQTGTRVP